jgi:hypothetical protein
MIVVLLAGGGGLLLLKDRHPLSANCSNRTTGARRMCGFLRGQPAAAGDHGSKARAGDEAKLLRRLTPPQRQVSPIGGMPRVSPAVRTAMLLGCSS